MNNFLENFYKTKRFVRILTNSLLNRCVQYRNNQQVNHLQRQLSLKYQPKKLWNIALALLLTSTTTALSSSLCDRKKEMTRKRTLYPASEAYDEGMLQVSEIHAIYYAQYGNPKGKPVLVVHGGPGGACFPGKPDLTPFIHP
jgi:hypothetical protein